MNKLAHPKKKALIAILLLSLVLAVSVPQLSRVRRRILLAEAFANLDGIKRAKEKFAKENKLNADRAIMDARDLVPRYIAVWPTSPPDHAIYAGNAVGVEPTVNGLTKAQLTIQCSSTFDACIF